MKMLAPLLASLALLSVVGLTQARSLDGHWSGTIRCQKKAVIAAGLSLRTQGARVSGTLSVTGVSGLPGAKLPKTSAPLSGTRTGNTINFSTPGPGGAPLALSATVRENGRVLAGGLSPKSGCEGFYFSH